MVGATNGETRCEQHRLAHGRAQDARRPNSNARGYDQKWRRYASSWLTLHPHCVMCGAKAEAVDHIDGRGPLGPRGYDPLNLQSVCAPCHARLSTSFGRSRNVSDRPPPVGRDRGPESQGPTGEDGLPGSSTSKRDGPVAPRRPHDAP